MVWLMSNKKSTKKFENDRFHKAKINQSYLKYANILIISDKKSVK